MQEWNISGAHMAERCKLFLIIALGESILVTGATFGQTDFTPGRRGRVHCRVHRQRCALVGLFRSQLDAAERAFASSSDPGRLGRSAYTYFHIPMVAGIIVTAVGDELAIAHPLGHTA